MLPQNDWEEAFALALAAFQNEKPFDLIAIDAFLPDFGALSLLRKLRQRAITTPTLVLTRMCVGFLQERGRILTTTPRGSPIPDELRSMSNEFLIKPVKQSALISAVSRILSPQTQNGNNSRRASQSDFPTIAEPSKLKVLVVDDNVRSLELAFYGLSDLSARAAGQRQSGRHDTQETRLQQRRHCCRWFASARGLRAADV